jgi:hypothetical protein
VNLSEPSSEEDDVMQDPDYYEDEASQGGEGTEQDPDDDPSDDDGDDSSEDEDEDSDDEEDEDEDSDDEEDEDDLDYDPMNEDEQEGDPIGVLEQATIIGVNVERGPGEYYKSELHLLDPETHLIQFGEMNVLERVSVFRAADRRGFDFVPSEMLRWVWRLSLLLNGLNPAGYAEFEPPIPNPGNYEEDGWTDDEEDLGGYGDESE